MVNHPNRSRQTNHTSGLGSWLPEAGRYAITCATTHEYRWALDRDQALRMCHPREGMGGLVAIPEGALALQTYRAETDDRGTIANCMSADLHRNAKFKSREEVVNWNPVVLAPVVEVKTFGALLYEEGVYTLQPNNIYRPSATLRIGDTSAIEDYLYCVATQDLSGAHPVTDTAPALLTPHSIASRRDMAKAIDAEIRLISVADEWVVQRHQIRNGMRWHELAPRSACISPVTPELLKQASDARDRWAAAKQVWNRYVADVRSGDPQASKRRLGFVA